MSIATELGDDGQTGLIGGARVSKANGRVEAYGTVDELGSFLAFARSVCEDAEIRNWTEEIQRTLFRVGAALAAPPGATKAPPIGPGDVDGLTILVHSLEARPGIVADWSLPGAHTGAAAFEMARTVCRRAERAAVRLDESGAGVDAAVLAYLNRLSDLLWLFARVLELGAGVESKLRENSGSSWSRAW